MNTVTELNLDHQIELFDLKRKLNSHEFDRLDELQQKFVSDFTVDQIKKLSLDEYVIGKGTSTSFCYRLERGLGSLGDMRGSTSSVFVVFYGKWGKDEVYKYRFSQKLGQVNDEFEALEKVKDEIIQLIEVGRLNNRDSIKSNRLSDLFKFKLLGTYYPDRYLNIYSHRHLDYFIGELGLNLHEKTILTKQDVLLAFKNEHRVAKHWSNYEFNNFLYDQFERPPSKEDEQEKEFYPPIEKIKPEIITQVVTVSDQPTNSNQGKGSAKPDYEEQQKRNTKLGKRGENIVFNLERSFFIKNKFPLGDLEHSSKENDRLGYDIKSLDENGKTKYIEVKSTKKKKGDASFIITENEKTKAGDLPNYFIYVVFEANTKWPKIWIIKEPFKGLEEKFRMTPINYRVEISVK